MGIRSFNFTSTYTQDVMDTSTETAAHCSYGNALVIVIFKGGCHWLLFSTTKSSFKFWLYQAYHAVSQIGSGGSIRYIHCPFLHLVLLYIQTETKVDTFWCGNFNNPLRNINFIITFSLASTNISSAGNLEYENEEHYEWLQQWNFKKRSKEENKIYLSD